MTKPHGYLVGILQTYRIDNITKTLQHMTTHNKSKNNDSGVNAQWTRTRKHNVCTVHVWDYRRCIVSKNILPVK